MDDSKIFSNKITKDDIIERYKQNFNSEPIWTNKKIKDMSNEERLEYANYRNIIIKERKKLRKEKKKVDEFPEDVSDEEFDSMKIDEKEVKSPQETKVLKKDMKGYYISNGQMSDEEKYSLVEHTSKKALDELFTPEQKQQIEKTQKEDKLLENYLTHHQIDSQEKLNYAIEHDEKFKSYLDKIGRLDEVYTGKHLKQLEKDKKKIEEELIKEAKKDKRGKIIKKFKKLKKKKLSNDFTEAKKELDLTAYRNKKMEKQGLILCIYLRKNGLANMRYVKMDEVGQIKIDGYVYHERDATYRFGKKNDPVLVIMEGALVPINKETLKENLGTESAEAQRLIIKGIEQAEVVKSGGLDDNAKKPFTPPKWVIGLVIAIAIGIYAYMGGFS